MRVFDRLINRIGKCSLLINIMVKQNRNPFHISYMATISAMTSVYISFLFVFGSKICPSGYGAWLTPFKWNVLCTHASNAHWFAIPILIAFQKWANNRYMSWMNNEPHIECVLAIPFIATTQSIIFNAAISVFYGCCWCLSTPSLFRGLIQRKCQR